MGEATLQQLLYTSSDIGLGGGGFQVRAASPGLRDLHARETMAATQLCAYTGQVGMSSSNLLSYGWVTLWGLRFVFHRWAGGVDSAGRPAVCAHIVVGPETELSPLFIAQRYGSVFWRRNDKGLGTSTTLDQIGLSDIAPGPELELDPDLVYGFVHAVVTAQLQDQRLVTVTTNSALQAALVAAAARVLPDGALSNMSMSTYEGPGAASNYTLVAVTDKSHAGAGADIFEPARPARDSHSPAGQLTTKLLSPAPARRELSELANIHGQFRYDILVSANILFGELQTGSTTTVDAILPVLQSPLAAHVVFEQPTGRQLVADALVAGRSDVWMAVADHTAALWYVTQANELGVALGQTLWARLAQLASHPHINDVLQQINVLGDWTVGPFIKTFLGSAKANPAALNRLPIQERLDVVRLAQANGMTIDGATLDALLTVTTTSGAVSVAKASDIELNWRMMAIVDCLAERPGTINQQILTVLVQDQQLAASAMRYLCGVFAVSTINTLMFRASSSQASILFEVASQAKIGPDGLAVVLLAYLSRDDISDSHGKLQFLNQWLASHDKVKTHPGVTATYCSWLADACLQHSLWVRAQDLPLLQNVADMARASALADSWKELLTVAARIDRPRDLYHYRHDLNAIVDRMPRDKHQEAAVELIADTLVGNCQNELDIDAIYNWKQSWTSLPLNRVARELLIAAARQSVTGSAELAALRWIVSRVQEGMLATQRTGRLSRTVELVDQELQTTVKDVFQRHSARIATALAMYALEQQGGVAAKWWPTIDPEASSRHQPTVQPGKKH